MQRIRSYKFLTKVRKYKEQPSRDKEYNKWNKKCLGIFYIPTVGINSRLNVAEWISVLEDRAAEVHCCWMTTTKKDEKRNEGTLIDLWNSALIFTLCRPQKENRDKSPEKIIEEIITENFHNMRRKKSPKSTSCRKSLRGLSKENHTKTNCNQNEKH